MSSFEATFRIGIIAIAGALLMIYMMRAIWEIEQDIQDEKRVKVRWMLLFNRHIPMLVAGVFISGIVALTLFQLGRDAGNQGASALGYMGALFYGAISVNSLVMGGITEFKRASILRQAQRRARESGE